MGSLDLEQGVAILYNLSQALEPRVESRELQFRGSSNWRKGRDLGLGFGKLKFGILNEDGWRRAQRLGKSNSDPGENREWVTEDKAGGGSGMESCTPL